MLVTNFTPFPTLTTSRLLLRALTPADAPALQHLRGNPDVMKYINRPLALTLADAEAWVAMVADAVEKNEGITWCMCRKAEPDLLVGTVGLWRFEKEHYRAEIGYMLEPRLHGLGLMSEAVKRVTEYGFADIKLHSIEGQLDSRNGASAGVLQKAGYVREAHFKENFYMDGGFTDTAVYSVLSPYPPAGGLPPAQ